VSIPDKKIHFILHNPNIFFTFAPEMNSSSSLYRCLMNMHLSRRNKNIAREDFMNKKRFVESKFLLMGGGQTSIMQ
jgi:hypothetical protein